MPLLTPWSSQNSGVRTKKTSFWVYGWGIWTWSPNEQEGTSPLLSQSCSKSQGLSVGWDVPLSTGTKQVRYEWNGPGMRGKKDRHSDQWPPTLSPRLWEVTGSCGACRETEYTQPIQKGLLPGGLGPEVPGPLLFQAMPETEILPSSSFFSFSFFSLFLFFLICQINSIFSITLCQ